MADVEKRRPMALGRGLSALLGDVATHEEGSRSALRDIEIAHIRPNPDQPRRHFEHSALEELAQSIARHGVLQPITVRDCGGDYLIIAGERRWRAAQLAQIHTIPAIVRSADEQKTLELALIENIQREQLNAVEEGEAYRRLMSEHGYTQDQLAQSLHKSRSYVANIVRLTELPQEVRDLVAAGKLSAGHARTLVGRDDAVALAHQAVAGHWSVRDIEARTKAGGPAKARASKPAASNADADIELLERQLADLLGLRVGIRHAGTGGEVTLSYATLDQLDMICQRLSGERI